MIKYIILTIAIFIGSFFILRSEKVIKNIQSRIEKNSVKIPNVSFEDNGNIQYEDIIINRSNIPLIGDWARIYPIVDEYGKINWINYLVGGKKNLIKLILIFALVGLVLLGFNELFSQIEYLKNNCICNLNI